MTRRPTIAAIVFLSALLTHSLSAAPKLDSSAGSRLEISEGLNLNGRGRRFFSRRLLPSNDNISQAILSGTWQHPEAGAPGAISDDSTGTWELVRANEQGVFDRLRGYLAVQVECAEDMVAILEASGHSIAYVNGVPHTGGLHLTYEPKGTSTPMAIALRKGSNDLVFRGRGMAMRAELVRPDRALVLYDTDATLPDLVLGQREEVWAALLLVNTADRPIRGVSIAARIGADELTTQVPALPPLAARKVAFQIPPAASRTAGKVDVQVKLYDHERVLADERSISLNLKNSRETHRRTFRSRIDGSVQYYAVKPADPVPGNDVAPALVLSLHGAGVQALNQANSYAAKSWAHIVAPTNRRPYGFNWEFVGAVDALEALADSRRWLETDPARTYLTGHSMGGHGTWHIGQTYPDQFAAIAPSAGWVTRGRYRSRGRELPENPSAVDRLLQRPANPNDTDRLAANLVNQAVYILHGSDDRSVPASHAHHMRDLLAEFHRDFTYYEEPDVGHWWDRSPALGVDCVDWLPMFELFSRRVLPSTQEVRRVSFVTANPGRSASCYWATIENQQRALDFSTVELQCDPRRRVIFGTTDNVARLSIDLSPLQPDESLTVSLDDQELPPIDWPADDKLTLERRDSKWSVTAPVSLDHKGPHRYGPFRAAFDNHVLFVYGTHGTPDENAAIYHKVRFDCETYWVGGNGSVDVVADHDFEATTDPDRNVVLYGNSDTNSAWSLLLGGSPVQVKRGLVTVGTRSLDSGSAACTFIYPRPNSDTALVGAIAPTGPEGVIPTYQLGYLGPSADYPDCTIWDADGNALATGFFGGDWSVERGEFAWQDDR